MHIDLDVDTATAAVQVVEDGVAYPVTRTGLLPLPGTPPPQLVRLKVIVLAYDRQGQLFKGEAIVPVC